MAPEQIPLKAPVSAATNIYAFGMCIWEAVTLDLPWKNKDTLAIFENVSRGKLPGRPRGIGDHHWELITKMCAPDPNRRVNITFVVNRLNQFDFQDEKIGKGIVSQDGSTKLMLTSSRHQIMDEYVFGELGDTIPDALKTINLKNELVADNAWMLTIVYPALRYIFALLREHQKTPDDIEVTTFCTALVRFQRYLRTALSEKSMYQLARSRRVAESHHLVYAGLDRLLDMLDVPETDKIRVWRPDSYTQSKFQGAAAGLEADADSSIQQTSTMSKAVVLNYFDTLSTNHQLWTRTSLANSIGQGAFGAIYKGSWLGTLVVVKFMRYEEDFDTISPDPLLHEVRVWHRLSHPHVLELYGACHTDKRYFVCEYAPNGDLTKFLKKLGNKHLTWQKLYEVALGLQYLHRRNIAHNDLKCDNTIVGMDGKAKVIDFGLSCLLNEAEIQIELKKMGGCQLEIARVPGW